MKRHQSQKSRSLYLAFALLGIAAIFSAARTLIASPLTGTSSSPATKITVYQGTMAITPGRGSSDTLEIGNPGVNGIELASTGKIYFRPSGVAGDHGAWFDTNGSLTDLYVTGKLYINGASVPPWPSGGGTSYWQQIGNALQPLPQGSIARGLQVIEPIADNNLENRAAMSAVSTGALATVTITNTLGNALEVTGDPVFNGNLNVTSAVAAPAVYIRNGTSYTFWYSGNDGAGSGLDADIIDGVRTFLTFYTSTNVQSDTRSSTEQFISCPSTGERWCLCSNDADGCVQLVPAL